MEYLFSGVRAVLGRSRFRVVLSAKISVDPSRSAIAAAEDGRTPLNTYSILMEERVGERRCVDPSANKRIKTHEAADQTCLLSPPLLRNSFCKRLEMGWL